MVAPLSTAQQILFMNGKTLFRNVFGLFLKLPVLVVKNERDSEEYSNGIAVNSLPYLI